MDKYKYDIAISLCKEDTDFARKLIAQLNPSLKVFYYENNQEEIIGKSGSIVFASPFKEARIVVILSRKEWGKSFYTELEMHSINDRVKNEGYEFLVVIPMMPKEIPVWYPETMIYANPINLTLDVISKIVEYKITERGGVVKQLTLEDRYQHLLDKIEDKKKLIDLQSTPNALLSVNSELSIIRKIFNSHVALLQNTPLGETRTLLFHESGIKSHYSINDYLLEINIQYPDEQYQKIVSTQDYTLNIKLSKVFGSLDKLNPIHVNNYKFYYSSILKGWATPIPFEQHASPNESLILFKYKDPERYQVTYYKYDLKSPISSEILLDSWFQILLEKATNNLNRYL